MEADKRPLFTTEEILILRGMIDDFQYREQRAKFWRSTMGTLVQIAGVLGALAVVASAVKALWG